MNRCPCFVWAVVVSAAAECGAAWLLPVEEDAPPPQVSVATERTSPPAAARQTYEISGLTLRTQTAGIVLEWKNPDAVTNLLLTVYRHDAVLDTADKLTPARSVRTIPAGRSVTSWTDTTVGDGRWFYAVTVTVDGVEHRTLTPEHAYNLVGVPYLRPAAPSPVTQQTPAPAPQPAPPAATAPGLPSPPGLLKAEVMGESVLLSWPTPPPGVRVRIYRDRRPITTVSNLTALFETVSRYLDMPPESGDYFYAVTAVSEAGENRTVTLGRNSLASPVTVSVRTPAPPPPEAPKVVEARTQAVRPAAVATAKTRTAAVPERKAEVPSAPKAVGREAGPAVAAKAERRQKKPEAVPAVRKDHADRLLEVRRRYYNAGDYATAARRFAELAADPACPPAVADEARLFLAKTLYHQGQYKESLRLFVRIRPVFPEEADFWIGRIASRL